VKICTSNEKVENKTLITKLRVTGAIFSISEIKNHLTKQEFVMALLKTSTSVEKILYIKLREKLIIAKVEEIIELEHFHFMKCYKWCKKLRLIDEDSFNSIKELIEKRNKLVHKTSYIRKLKSDRNEQKEVQRIIEENIEFIKKYQTQ